MTGDPPIDLPGDLPTDTEFAEFLGRQRWFSGHGSIEVTGVRRLARLVDDPPVDVLMLDAKVDDGETVCADVPVRNVNRN